MHTTVSPQFHILFSRMLPLLGLHEWEAQEWLDRVLSVDHEVGDGLPEGDVGDHFVLPWTSDE